MLRLANLRMHVEHSPADLESAALAEVAVEKSALRALHIRRRSLDARGRRAPFFIYTLDLDVAEEERVLEALKENRNVAVAPDIAYTLPARIERPPAQRPVIIGAGPSGLFAALVLARTGFAPLILERGKPSEERAKDVAGFWRTGTLDPESNVQFGEGGAGAFSDGKLTTQIKDRGNRMRLVLEELVDAGAPSEILYESKPHIGTDRLLKVLQNLRERIVSLGGEFRFQTQVTDLEVEDGRIVSLTLNGGARIAAKRVVLAIGHSARDTFETLERSGVAMEAKPFAIGARIEHPQSLVDKTQYGRHAGAGLGPADYKLVSHCPSGRSGYTFCMCPGGRVIAAASEPGHLVTNGMSAYARNQPNANSALLVAVLPKEFGAHALAGVEFQRRWERLAFALGGENYHAPAQRLDDFLAGRPTKSFGDVEPSYAPGVVGADLAECLPPEVVAAMRLAIKGMDRKMPGFARPDAVLTGVETRSSSPLRIPRDETLQSTSTTGLYPAGEGAGHAGGIMSAAVDGIQVAEAVAASYRR